MKKKTLMLMALTAFSQTACAGPRTVNQAAPQGRVIEFRSDANGFDTRTFFYEGAREVVAFDTQFTPELARKSVEHLRKFTKKPITWLVVTHPNPDKFNGIDVFRKEGARVIASRATADALAGVHAYKRHFFVNVAKMFTEESYPTLGSVDETFEDELTLTLRGGERIELREYNRPGVSSNQTVAHVPSVGALMVGDLIHHKAHAWLEGGIVNGKATPTVDSWIALLGELGADYDAASLVYGGRGETARLSEATAAQRQYLERAEREVREYIESLGSRVGELQGAPAQTHHHALAQRLARVFPDYALSYLVDYGVYGLVNQILSE